jgi:hypothetical protein
MSGLSAFFPAGIGRVASFRATIGRDCCALAYPYLTVDRFPALSMNPGHATQHR